MTRSDDTARERIRTDLDETFVVEAAAGTGKTTMLVERILAVLRQGRAGLDELVAVTFTEKAAGEMKLRLRGEIERVRTHADTPAVERERLNDAIAKLEVARIGTIHSLCIDFLKEFPVEAEVDPLFEVAPPDDQERLLDTAFDRWFAEVLQTPPEGVRRILRRRPRGGSSPREELRRAAMRLIDRRDFDGVWERDPAFDRNAEINEVFADLQGLAEYVEAAKYRDDNLRADLAQIRRFVREQEARERVRQRDHDGLEAELRSLARAYVWYRRGRGEFYGEGLQRSTVLDKRTAVKSRLDAFLERSEADLAACLHRDLQPLVAAYEDLKDRAGSLDFLDLLLRARDLVRNHRSVRERLQSQIRHIFIDEFQDTDPLQSEILVLLAAQDADESDWRRVKPVPGKLFVVGDPKQSIYRFRRADVALYNRARDQLIAAGAVPLVLSTSYRAVPSIQAAVNAAFEPVMPGEAGVHQADYVPLEPARDEVGGQPTVIALPVPAPFNAWGDVRKKEIDASLPEAVAALIEHMIQQGRSGAWTVSSRENPDERVPLEARHICLLFRRFKGGWYNPDATRLYRRELEARHIPHVLVGGRSFHDREEIIALRNALQAIEWPSDEFSVYATLRGPFFALRDDQLLVLRSRFGSLQPMRRYEDVDDEVRPVVDALHELARLHHRRNRRPIADTISRFLEATRAHASLAIWPSGEQSLANVLRLVDMARRFEGGGATSFRGFVEHLLTQAERGQAAEAPVLEEGTDGVRVMTVHQAKGLEFPVVILCDITTGWGHKDTSRPSRPSCYVDPDRRIWAESIAGCVPPILLAHREEAQRADEAEEHRIAYVAATRARDLLVVPAVGDGPSPGWLDVFDPALYPPKELYRQAESAPGCPDLGDDTTRDRPDRPGQSREAGVHPGAHRPERGAHTVVWWGPQALRLDVEPDVGLRQDKLLRSDKDPSAAEVGRQAHARWRERVEGAVERGGRPSLESIAATAAATTGIDLPGDVHLESVVSDRASRPRGKRFGTLVHAVLAAAPLSAEADALARIAASQGRLVGAPASEVDAAASVAATALAHPTMRAALAGEHRRETPVFWKGDDGVLVEGVVDLAYTDGETWTVVDFKTDAELDDERRAEYEAQVRLYMAGITAATGAPTRGILLWV